ncbi:MAG: hypothetical protein R3Y28_05145, partial [Candidatus Gastranaerophilales bacterium]
YNRDNRSGGYNQGGYNRDNRSGGYNQGGYDRDNRSGGYNRPPQQNRFNRPSGPNNRRPNNRNQAPKPLLISREQLEQIEMLYKMMLPLPNHDCHETIGAKIDLEPRKVFFGINLVRQKLMLPKLSFPKRKLAISPDQLFAIKNLYEPLLPLPPIGCHKIIAAQLKMDEWRVHVGIGLIRAQMGMERWNSERADAPEEFKKANNEVEATEVQETPDTKVEEVKVKKPRATKKKVEEIEVSDEVENSEKLEKPVKAKKTTKKEKE